jgi:hypothetical protein
MNEYAATQADHSPPLVTIRRAESVAFAAMAFVPLIVLGSMGAPASLVLFAAAAIRLPRHRTREASAFETHRLEVLRELLTEGTSIHARYTTAEDLPGSLARASSLALVRIDILQWIADSRARLERYPEFAGIFEAHGGVNLGDELEGRLERLRELMHLARTSRRLNLPI